MACAGDPSTGSPSESRHASEHNVIAVGCGDSAWLLEKKGVACFARPRVVGLPSIFSTLTSVL
jgi:hypothetical protein